MSSIAATGAFALVARTAKPAGAAATKTPWLAPTRNSLRHIFEEHGVGRQRPRRVAVLALRRRRHCAAEHVRHQLHAVADAEHRHAGVEHGGLALRRARIGDALRSAGENDAHRFARADTGG